MRGNGPEYDVKETMVHSGTPSTADPIPNRRRGNFVATYGEGELLKEGEGEQTLKDRYIIRVSLPIHPLPENEATDQRDSPPPSFALLQVGWDDVRGFASLGGTLIGTARCAAFRETEGRRTAALNLVKHGIDALVVCGGDGSLTGADRLRAEWPEHLAALKERGELADLPNVEQKLISSPFVRRRHLRRAIRYSLAS